MATIKGLPEFEFSFNFDIEGKETKRRFLGEFTYKRPNIGQQSQIERYKTRLDEDLKNIDSSMSFLHKMLAHLRFTLSEFPKWWEESDFGLNLWDVNVVTELYKTVMEFESKFIVELPKEVDKVAKDE